MWKTYTGGPAAAPIASPGGGGAAAGMAGQWHPTVIYMLVLVLIEVLIVGWLTRAMLR